MNLSVTIYLDAIANVVAYAELYTKTGNVCRHTQSMQNVSKKAWRLLMLCYCVVVDPGTPTQTVLNSVDCVTESPCMSDMTL